MIQVFGISTPDLSLAGQKRMWWPHGPGQPWLTSGVGLLSVSSLHSEPSTLSPKTGPGVKDPLARAVVEPLRRGRTVWASVAVCVKIAVRPAVFPLLNQ